MISKSELKDRFSYNHETGIFINLKTLKPALVKRKGRRTSYIAIYIEGNTYCAHRLAYLYMTGKFPDLQIDHIDRDGLNNKWENLREVSNIENARNRGVNSNNKSGVPGIYWDKRCGKWIARIDIPKGRIHLGTFSSFLDACCSRKSAEKKYLFHPNYGRNKKEIAV